MEAAVLPTRRRPLAVPAAAGLAALTLLATVGTAMLVVANTGRPAEGNTLWTVSSLVPTALFAIVGLLIVRAQPRNAIGWIALAGGVTGSLSGLAAEWARHDPAGPGAEWAWWTTAWLFIPTFVATVTLLPLVVPDGRLPSPRWRPLAWLALGLAAFGTVDSMITPYDRSTDAAFVDAYGFENPLATGDGVSAVPDAAYFALLAACVAAALGSLALRIRRAREVEGQQLKWILLGVLGLLAGVVSGFASDALAPWTVAAGLTVLATCMGFAALRHGLWDVDLVLQRSLVYGGLTAGVVALYALSVAVLSDALGASVLTAVSVAVLAEPARRRAQRAAARVVYGERDDPAAVVERLSARLAGAAEPGTLLPEVTATIAASLRLPSVEIVPPGEGGRGIAVPLVHAGERVGDLVASPRPGGGLGRADRAALERLAPQVAVAVHAARLTDDLRRSRERLLSAREDERRRLRRDLHDGLGPNLAAFTLQLEAARDLLGRDPQRAQELITSLTAHMRAQVDEVRRIVQDLRPPILDDLGLAEALRQQAERFAGIDIEVRTPEALGDLPAAVEVAAYRIAGEALANVARHARAGHAVVSVDLEPGRLRLAVEDDGRGLDVVRGHGVGLRSMRERAEELGGTCAVGPGAGGRGCRVEAVLPL